MTDAEARVSRSVIQNRCPSKNVLELGNTQQGAVYRQAGWALFFNQDK